MTPPVPPQPRAWPPRYTLIGLTFAASFICYIDRVNISVAVIAMAEEFAWSETAKGFVLSAFFVGYLIMQVPSGWLANRHGGRLVLVVAVLCWSLFTILTPPAAYTSMGALIATRILLGLGESAMYPSVYNLYARRVPKAERSRAIAILTSGIPLGTLAALSTTGWIVTRLDWPAAFYLFGAVGLLWAVLWLRLVPAEASLLEGAPPDDRSRGLMPWRTMAAKPAIWALVFNHFCSNWALYMLLAWLPSYFRNALGVSITAAGLYSAAPWLTMFVMANAAGWIADDLLRRGLSTTAVRKLMQGIGLIGPAVFLLLAREVESAPGAMGLMCGALGLLAFTWSGFGPNHLDIAPRHADVLMGITNTFGTIPGIIGVAVTGLLVDLTGTYAAAFVLAAAVNVAGTVIWLLFASGEPVID
jgi:ACS family sodium-dependent inorganic phosphate cotransporter